MSGTSLDGLDMAYCEFSFDEDLNKWTYLLGPVETVPLTVTLSDKLINCMGLSGLELSLLDLDLGRWMGDEAKKFIKKYDLAPEIVASHGHTIFHQPERGLTLQIGRGTELSAHCGLPVINDFRSADMALGGQGAPLVPVGDKLLFSEFTACINLGGISNISFEKEDVRVAWDISPVNIILNRLANEAGLEFDKDGQLAAGGDVHEGLLGKLNALDYYQYPGPKSLGYEWIESAVFHLLDPGNISLPDRLRTAVEHIAIQLANAINDLPGKGKVLFTGGGALNAFLMERTKDHVIHEDKQILVPDISLVQYKEALIFAFLGVLRLRKEPNCLASVTGAIRDNVGGVYYE